jgi:hypothetical protein
LGLFCRIYCRQRKVHHRTVFFRAPFPLLLFGLELLYNFSRIGPKSSQNSLVATTASLKITESVSLYVADVFVFGH